VNLVPGVCGVVQGSVHPQHTGIGAGLSAVGDIFNAIASRAGTDVLTLSQGLENYRAGQTGLLRMTWDNGDRTVLVSPNLRGVTLGWNLQSTAQDELFAAIEGTAFHARVILDRMAGHGVTIQRVINAGGIPQKNDVLNQVYANVLGRPVLVPNKSVVSLGSAIFAFLAAGTEKAGVGGSTSALAQQSLLGFSRFNLLVVLVHGVIPFLKFRVGQKVYVGFCHDAASFVHRVNDNWIYSRIARSLQ
jgi:ribulose kinase